MSRPLRIEYPGAVYHVTARGIEKRNIFADDADRRKFLEKLHAERDRSGIRLYAYVLMKNHYHLLIETPEANLSSFMHRFQSSYTNYFNRRRRRVGHLFQGRYKAIVVEKESYLTELSRYIHLNPVRAGAVEKPEKYKWSSYLEYITRRATGGADTLVERGEILKYFGRTHNKAIPAYRKWVEAAIGIKELRPEREATGQIILGAEKFVESIRKMISGRDIPFSEEMPAVRKIRKWDIEHAESAIATIAQHFDCAPDKLTSSHSKNNLQRDIAVYIFQQHSRWTLRETGELFDISYSAAGKSASRARAAIARNKKLQKEMNELNSKFQT